MAYFEKQSRSVQNNGHGCGFFSSILTNVKQGNANKIIWLHVVFKKKTHVMHTKNKA
jgi:hypothetical protein